MSSPLVSKLVKRLPVVTAGVVRPDEFAVFCALAPSSMPVVSGAWSSNVDSEGVETVEQLRYLRKIGCDVAQGYLVAHPLEADTLADWCDEFERRWPQLAG